MAEGNGNGNTSNYSVKEILTQFIVPALEEIKESLDKKTNINDFQRLEADVREIKKTSAELPTMFNKVKDLETRLTSPERVAQMINDGLQASKARGWSVRERILGGAVGIMTFVTLILNLLTK